MPLRFHSRRIVLAVGAATALAVGLAFPLAAAAAAAFEPQVLEPEPTVGPTGGPVTPEQRIAARATLRDALEGPAPGLELPVDEPEPSEEATAPEPQSSPAQVAVETALAQVGDPYVWAAVGPDAFDCSGLTMFAWARAGVALPHNSGRQYASLPSVSRDELRPGDLVFSGYGGISHVGMYIGDGQMVHASRTGKPVMVSPIRSNYIGAARPAP